MNFDRELREFKARRHGLLASDTNTSEIDTKPYMRNISNTINDICRKIDKIDSAIDSFFESVDVDDDEKFENARKILKDFAAIIDKKIREAIFTDNGCRKKNRISRDMVVEDLLSMIEDIFKKKIEKLEHEYLISYVHRNRYR